MPELVIRRGLAEPDTSASFVPHKPLRPEKSEGGRPFRIVSGVPTEFRGHTEFRDGVPGTQY